MYDSVFLSSQYTDQLIPYGSQSSPPTSPLPGKLLTTFFNQNQKNFKEKAFKLYYWTQ